MCKEIESKNYDGSILKVKVSIEIYKFDKKNKEQERWRERKRSKEANYDELCKIYETNSLPKEFTVQSAESKFLKQHQLEALHKAINKLPETQRRRIILRYFYRLSLTQISQIEKVKIQVIDSSIQKGLKNLKKCRTIF